MKKIEAFVRHARFNAVRDALVGIGYRSMIRYEIWYRGTEIEISHQQADGSTPLSGFMPKVKIELVVDDTAVQHIIDAISESAKTGHIGDGKIFITPAEEAIQI